MNSLLRFDNKQQLCFTNRKTDLGFSDFTDFEKVEIA